MGELEVGSLEVVGMARFHTRRMSEARTDYTVMMAATEGEVRAEDADEAEGVAATETECSASRRPRQHSPSKTQRTHNHRHSPEEKASLVVA